MQEPEPNTNGIQNLRRWITWAAVIGTALWAGYFFIFLIYQSIVGSATSNNWFLQMVQEHPAATIGIAMSAITAFCLVALLEIARGPIEFEAMGFKFKGASGPVILWVFCFLAMIFGVWLLWDKKGAGNSAIATAPTSKADSRILLTRMSYPSIDYLKYWESTSAKISPYRSLPKCHINRVAGSF
ncbi:hypothetical protein [Microbulbifer variabilis]|uniref:Uncharacterized protein n=1 Tax=Microbulbifer variabilis TaxID=266805 RepID=A0ABY4VGX4_9GAMM|nr:hypothetical protein [Microbulbifer variabilis]USD22641.1 hypothetical protein MJO52_05775 [Microbulbifer variabilis]